MTISKRYRERMASVSPMFSSSDGFRLLACDADSIIYRVAATTNNLETAKRRFVQQAMTLQLLAGADMVRLHLTPKHCRKAGRFNVLAVKEYQGNRKNSKGKPALVEPLRYAVGRKKLDLPSDMEVVFNDIYEADDSVIMDGVKWGDSCVIYSEDKDLLCTRNMMLCPETSLVLPGLPSPSVGTLALKELSSSKKVVGRGPLFFWAQMLMGDTADNIAGLTKYLGKQVGPVRTWDLLSHWSGTQNTEFEVAHFVLSCYRENGQNPWPEGWLLWLYPEEGHTFHKYLNKLGIMQDAELGPWLQEQLRLKWFNKETDND